MTSAKSQKGQRTDLENLYVCRAKDTMKTSGQSPAGGHAAEEGLGGLFDAGDKSTPEAFGMCLGMPFDRDTADLVRCSTGRYLCHAGVVLMAVLCHVAQLAGLDGFLPVPGEDTAGEGGFSSLIMLIIMSAHNL